MHGFGNRRWVSILQVLALGALAACADKRIEKLSTGISRDSLLRILAAEETSADSLPHVYRAERYLIKGQILEVLFYTKTNAKAGKDTLPEKKLTPIVLQNGKVGGWGWSYFDSLAKADSIPEKPRN
jgi:hypothetical protein